jgi:AbrB family transcriptional regulator, transcriptional pleiotropic regulator of transition state genes
VKSTGIVRKLDSLGRIVIPMELRRVFGLAPDDEIEILVEDDKIVLQKFESHCIFCQNEDNLTEYKGKQICGECLEELNP